MAITDWPTNERPREKLLQRGPSALSDAELLAIFLRTGVKGKSAVDLARELLDQHKGLGNLLAADRASFCRSHGLGSAKYAQLQAVLEMSRRHLRENLDRGEAITNPRQTREYLQARLSTYPQEVFACLFLDTRHRVIEYEELFRGTIDGASVHPREVVKRALAHNAAALILAHNHPSGIAEPSQADRSITQQLKQALALVDIRLLDHMVIGHGEVISMAEQGDI
ncbi:RadC family protein [Sedimenticola selenatireducens]|jgi:DNA repair protein RadC|uniref:JAB domain-containing protein n=1 Tax=Sedimenticola selenatireducens TaxID=191960 RepID=A0A558DU31_9GAMM|nr:DNA repair protein RadC [Sedimenticola selenatireducens]TVO77047.1 JAB domain-containing protein [Sedimenticola selenatireducens]TVT64489.1 MAG: JAB domain-containing protein [Sedimenticola selenatireducens]